MARDLPWKVTATFWDRYWAKVEKTDGCWLWCGATRLGYGRIGVGGHQGRVLDAHRVAYEAFVGPVPEGLQVLHRCDVPACVRPEHLFVGTLRDNMADMVAKGRSARGPRPWQELTSISCPECGRLFKPYRKHGRPPKRWCSVPCSNRGRTRERAVLDR